MSADGARPRLFHFTSPTHWPAIQAAGRLRVTESNVSPRQPHVGPDVVWLLDVPELDGRPHGLYLPDRPRAPDFADKTRVRIEVRAPYSARWVDWAWTHRMDPRWRDAIVAAGGGIEAAEHWYVHPAPIPARCWVSAVDARTGEDLLAGTRQETT